VHAFVVVLVQRDDRHVREGRIEQWLERERRID
jgi:hypothetical protein